MAIRKWTVIVSILAVAAAVLSPTGFGQAKDTQLFIGDEFEPYLLHRQTTDRAVMLSTFWTKAVNDRRVGHVLILHANEMQDPLGRGFRIREYRVTVDCKDMAVRADRALQGDLRLRRDGMLLGYGGGLSDLADTSIPKAVCAAPPSEDKDGCCFALPGQGEQPGVQLGTVKGFSVQLRPEVVEARAPGACETKQKGERFRTPRLWPMSPPGPLLVATRVSTTCILRPPYPGLEQLASFGGATTSSVRLKFCDRRLVDVSIFVDNPAPGLKFKDGTRLMGLDYASPFSGYLADSFIRSGMFPSAMVAIRAKWLPASADPKFLGVYFQWEWNLGDWTVAMPDAGEAHTYVLFKPQGSEMCEQLLEPAKDIK